MGEVLLPPGNFQQLPLNCTRKISIQQYQWHTSRERLFFFLHQPFQIANWNIEKQHDPRLPSVHQSETVLTQHQTRAKHKVRVRDEDCAKSKSSRHNVRSRWSKIEHGNHFNREQVWNSFQNAPHPSKMLFLDTENVLRGEILGVRTQKNWGRDCVLWRKKNFNKGCWAWSVPSVSSVVCTGVFERGDWLKWNQERHEVGLVIFCDFEFRRRKLTGDLECWRQWSSFWAVNGSTVSEGFEELHPCRWGRTFERWHWIQSRSVGLKWRRRDSWWQLWCSFSSGVCSLRFIFLRWRMRSVEGVKESWSCCHCTAAMGPTMGVVDEVNGGARVNDENPLGHRKNQWDGWVLEDQRGECWREKIVIQATCWLHVTGHMISTEWKEFEVEMQNVIEKTRAKKALRCLKGTRHLNFSLTIPVMKPNNLSNQLKNITGFSDTDPVVELVVRAHFLHSVLRWPISHDRVSARDRERLLCRVVDQNCGLLVHCRLHLRDSRCEGDWIVIRYYSRADSSRARAVAKKQGACWKMKNPHTQLFFIQGLIFGYWRRPQCRQMSIRVTSERKHLDVIDPADRQLCLDWLMFLLKDGQS